MINSLKRLMTENSLAVSFFLASVSMSFGAFAEQTQQPTIAIIIDDIGNLYKNGAELARFPYPLTLSFLPKRPHTQELIKIAEQNHKEIMLHSPMENSHGLKLGYGALTEDMSEQQIKSTLADSIKNIHHMVGINNHMGSRLTSNPIAMRWVMETIQKHPFFFVDSRTSSKTVAADIASSYRIPNLSRDVFLDHKQTRGFIQKQFNKLIRIAKETGTALAIGHPHASTIEYLSRALPKLDERGVSISTVSALWQIRHPKLTMQQYAHSNTAFIDSIAQHSESSGQYIHHKAPL